MRICVCTGRTSRRYQDVGFRGTPKGSSPFLCEPSSSSLMCLPCFYLLLPPPPPPTFPIFSFAGRSPHSIFLMLQRCTPATRAFTPWRVSRDEEIRFAPARKWRNYIRGRVEEEERKSQRRGSNGACETWTRSLAFAENTIRKRFSRKVFFFLSIRRGWKSRGRYKYPCYSLSSSRQW